MPKSRAQVTKVGQNETSTRKRTDTEIARDRALIAELHYKGHNDSEITAVLNARNGVEYELSRRQITYDRNQMLKQWQAKSQENTELWLAEAMMEISAVQRSAWNAWEASLEERERKEVEEIFDQEMGELRIDKIKRKVIQGMGNKTYLDVVLNCIKEKNRLRGLHEVKLRVDQRVRSEHVVKTYHTFDPNMWDDAGIEVVEGEIVRDQKQIGDGNGSPE